jgi:hypothetical protein
MTHIHMRESTFHDHLAWNNARIIFLATCLIALIIASVPSSVLPRSSFAPQSIDSPSLPAIV